MPAVQSDTINVRSEKAIGGYIRGFRDPNSDSATFEGEIDYDCTRSGVLEGVAVYDGRITQKRSSPSIVVMCASSEKPWDEAAWYKATIEIKLFTHRHESAEDVKKSEVVHNQRARAIEQLIFNEELLKEQLNKPDPALPDTRAVDQFRIEGSFPGDNTGEVSEDMIVETWELELFCYPYD